MQCSSCRSTKKQHKAGFNPSGSQRYRCSACGRVYTPWPNPIGYVPEIRLQAIRLYMEGNSLRAIGRILKVNHQTVANWINAYTATLPAAELPEPPKVAELDELYTFIGQNKMKSTS